jgi:hypothetical protein
MRRKERKGQEDRVREGQIVAAAYNEVSSRPYPINRLRLDQSIRVEMVQEFGTFLAVAAAVPAFGAASFALSSFSAATPYTSLFDQYKFEQVEAWIETPIAQGSTTFPTQLVSCVDLDDANTPTTLSLVQNHQGALMTGGAAGHYHKWVPHMAVAVYSGAFTSFSNAPAGWIDSGSPSVQHYGLKAGVSNATSIPVYTLIVRAVLAFRAPGIA